MYTIICILCIFMFYTIYIYILYYIYYYIYLFLKHLKHIFCIVNMKEKSYFASLTLCVQFTVSVVETIYNGIQSRISVD